MLPYAKSLDTVGFFTHTPLDMLALWEAMGHSSGRDEALTFGVPDPMPEVDVEMATAFQNAIDALRRSGIVVRSVDIAGLLKNIDSATNDVAFYEAARFHEQRWKETGLGTPAVSIPLPVSGLPLGLQLTADRGHDARVLRAAVQLHRLLT